MAVDKKNNQVITQTLDARRLICPMPVIKTQQTIKRLSQGDVLEVICSDPGSLHDIPVWCRIYGHEILAIEENKGEIAFYIKVSFDEPENDGTDTETW